MVDLKKINLKRIYGLVQKESECSYISPAHALALLYNTKDESKEQRTSSTLAAKLKCDESDVKSAYSVCKKNGFCNQVDDRYHITPKGEQFIVDIFLFTYLDKLVKESRGENY